MGMWVLLVLVVALALCSLAPVHRWYSNMVEHHHKDNQLAKLEGGSVVALVESGSLALKI